MKTIKHAPIALVAAAVFAAAPLSTTSANQDKVTETIAAEHLVKGTNYLLRTYTALPPEYRKLLSPIAVYVAWLRRPAMAVLIDELPESAIQQTLSRIDRVNLPPLAVEFLETQVDTTADFNRIQYQRVFTGNGFEIVDEPMLFLELQDQTIVSPSIFGRRLEQLSKEGVPVHGVSLGDGFAWSDLPYRILDPLEKLQNQIPPDVTAVFVGGNIQLISDDMTLADLLEELIEREAFAGPVLLDPLDDDVANILLDMLWTTGDKDILWLPVDFNEAPGNRFVQSPDTDATVADANDWIVQSSRGNTSIGVTYFPGILRLEPEAFANASRATAAVIGAAVRGLEAYDRDNGGTGAWLASNFDRLVILVDDVLTNEMGDVRRGAFANDARYMVFYGVTLPFSLQHELGHTYWFGHTFYLRPSTPDRTGPGIELPMPWTYMGQSVAGGDNRQHPNAANKRAAYWLSSAEWLDATAGGTFRIVAHDIGPIGFASALRIQTDDAREYWVDMRRLWDEVSALDEGIQVYYVEDTFSSRFIGNPVHVGPATSISPFTSPLAVGQTIEDPTRGVRIRLLAIGESPFMLGVDFADVLVERF